MRERSNYFLDSIVGDEVGSGVGTKCDVLETAGNSGVVEWVNAKQAPPVALISAAAPVAGSVRRVETPRHRHRLLEAGFFIRIMSLH